MKKLAQVLVLSLFFLPTIIIFQNCSSSPQSVVSLSNPTAQSATGAGSGSSSSGSSSSGSSSSSTSTGGNSQTNTGTQTYIPAAGSPYVLYTDIISGPNSGGENNNGIYLSIFGKNFGTGGLGTNVKVYLQNDKDSKYYEVAKYIYSGVSNGRTDIQQITVQIGALGSPTPGKKLPIKVVVNGVDSNTDQTFMVNPGNIYFVDNVSGNDSTGVAGNIAKPFRYVQTPSLGGAWGKVTAGDFIIMRGHGNTNPWVDVGFEKFFLRYRDKSGTFPTGVSGSGAIAVMGYPGEDTYIRGLVSNGMTGGCISAINGESFTGMGQGAVITNLRIDCEGYDGPISQEVFGHNWRVVNNDLSASTANTIVDPLNYDATPRMAGITGNGFGSFWYGNQIHDIQGSDEECHGIYIDGKGSYEIGYNYIHNIRSGNGIQVYVSGGNGSDYADNVFAHHNIINTVSKHGFNISDNSRNNFYFYNNIVINTAKAGIQFNSSILSGAYFFNNTFYKTNTSNNSASGSIRNDSSLNGSKSSPAVTIENNIFVASTGTLYDSGSNGVIYSGSGAVVKNNLWFNGTDSMPGTGKIADPLFTDAANLNFHLKAASPALGIGTTTYKGLSTSYLDELSGITIPKTFLLTDFDSVGITGTSLNLGALQQ